ADFAFGRESKGTPSQSGCNLSVFYHGLVLLLILQNVRYVLRRLSVIRDAVAALSEILRNCATAGVVCGQSQLNITIVGFQVRSDDFCSPKNVLPRIIRIGPFQVKG